MVPAFCVNSLGCCLWVLVVAQHHVHTSGQYLANDVLRILAVYLDLHSWSRLSARAFSVLLPILVADDWRALCGSVADCVVEADRLEEVVNFRIECRTADYNLVILAAEHLSHLRLHHVADSLAHDWEIEQYSHRRCLKLWQNGLLDDFLDYQRNCYNQMRLDVRECAEQNLRTWHTCQEVDVSADTYLVKELESHAVHVRHRQHRNYRRAGVHRMTKHLACEYHVRPQRSVRDHNALRESRCSACVVDNCQFVWVGLVVRHTVLTELRRVLLAEQLVQMFARISEFLAARDEHCEIHDRDDAFKVRHLLLVEVRPYPVAGKEHLRLGMVHYIMNLVWLEFVEDWHCYGSVCDSRQECDSPVRRVSAADCDLVALLDASVLEYYMELGDSSRHIVILECGALVIGQSVSVPIGFYTIFKYLVKCFFLRYKFFHCTIFI